MTTWTDGLLFFPLKDRSKEPATAHGHLDARPIGEWTVQPQNWGIRCGPESGITVVDVDPRNGGRLEDVLPLLPTAPRVKTGGGGWHFYCRNVPAGAKFVRLPGIDFKNNGYVVAPGSIHPSGNPYEWEQEGELPPFPSQWILPEEHVPSAGLPSGFLPDDISDMLRVIPSDDRETWLAVGMALHSASPGDYGFSLWVEWSKTTAKGNFKLRDCKRVWASFKSDGGITVGTIEKLARENGYERHLVDMDVFFRKPDAPTISEPPDIPFSPAIPVPALEEIRRWIAEVSDPVSAIAGALSIAALKFARTAKTSKGDLPILYFGLVGPTATNAIPVARAVEHLIRKCHLTWMLRGGSIASEEKLKRALLHSSTLFHFSHSWASNIAFSYRQPSGAMSQALRTLELIWHGSNLQHDPEKKNEEPQWIFSPSISLIAGIGEEEFPKILSSDELGRGAHETMLYIPSQKTRDSDLADPPPGVVRFLQGDALADALPPSATVDPVPVRIRVDDSDIENPSSLPAFHGYRRIARRIALLLTLSHSYRAETVPPEFLAWSFQFCAYCAAKLQGVETGGTGKPTLYSKIFDFLRKCGTKGATYRELTQYVWEYKQSDVQKRSEIIGRMEEDGAIVRMAQGRTERLYASEFARKVSHE